MSDLAKMKIIDAHQHLHDVRRLDDLMALGREFGYDAVTIACWPCGGVANLAQNAGAILAKAAYPGRVYAFGGLEYHWPDAAPDRIDPASQLEELLAIGFDGLKMLEGKPTVRKDLGIALDAPLYDGLFTLCQERQTPILYHVADPEGFWDGEKVPQWAVNRGWFYGDGSYPTKQQLYDEVEAMLEKFPGLNLFFAHFYFKSMDPAGTEAIFERFPTVCFDICPGTEMYPNFSIAPDEWRDIFTRYQDRIIYGTDLTGKPSPEARPRMELVRRFLETDEPFDYYRMKIHGIGLAKAVLEKIYHKNFERLTGQPEPLEMERALGHCRQTSERAGALPAPAGDKVREALEHILSRLEAPLAR